MSRRSLVAVVIVPLLLGAVLLSALHDPAARMSGVTAAIVNEDRGVRVDGRFLPVGRALAGRLVAGEHAGAVPVRGNYTWVMTSAADAAEGLAGGRYAAVVTIPRGFSAAATSLSKDGPVRPATIDVRTAQTDRALDAELSTTLARASSQAMGATVTETYLKNLYVSLAELRGRLGDAADASRRLASGTADADTGAGRLVAGATALRGGAGELSDGLRQLAGGAGQGRTGAAQLADGSGELAAGAGRLATGTRTLSTGARTVAGGARRLRSGSAALESGNTSLAAALASLKVAADGLAGPLGAVDDRARAGSSGAAALASGMGAHATALRQLAADCAPAGAPAEYCARVGAAAATADGDAATAGRVAADAAQLSDAAAQAVARVGAVTAGAASASSAGAQVAGGAGALAAGASQLDAGARKLSSGVAHSAAGAGDLAGGARRLASGAGALARGSSELADGAARARDGAAGLASGSRTLAGGLDTLASGTGRLRRGATRLASGLAAGHRQIPAYSARERARLADVAARPIRAHGGSTPEADDVAPLIVVVSLWIGALAMFLRWPGLRREVLTSRRSSLALLRAGAVRVVGLGAAQGMLVALVAAIIVGPRVGTAAALVATAAFAGGAFAAVNGGVVALLGAAGRLAALVVAAATVAAGIVSAIPGGLLDAAAVLPTHAAIELVGGVLAGTFEGGALAALVGWLAGGVVLAAAAVARSRTITVRRLGELAPA